MRIAKIVSLLLGPIVSYPVLFFLLLFTKNNFNQEFLKLLPFLFILHFCIPFLALYLGRKIKFFTDWELEDINERKYFLIILCVSFLISLIPMYIFSTKDYFLSNICLSVLILITAIISIFWKISLHVGALTVLIISLILYNQNLFLLLPLIIILGWSRIYMKKHSLSQVVVSFFLNSVLYLSAIYFTLHLF